MRVLVAEFAPGRSLRRVIEANQDLVPRRLQATPTSEQYSLFRAYIDARHANGRVDASELEAALEVGGPVIETGEDV